MDPAATAVIEVLVIVTLGGIAPTRFAAGRLYMFAPETAGAFVHVGGFGPDAVCRMA